MLPDTHYQLMIFYCVSSMLISCIKEETNNMMISHDGCFNCCSTLSLPTVLPSLYSLSSHYIIKPATILSVESTSQFEIGLLIFAWCSTVHGEVMTNLISSLICCHEFTTHFRGNHQYYRVQPFDELDLILIVKSITFRHRKYNFLLQTCPFQQINSYCKSVSKSLLK